MISAEEYCLKRCCWLRLRPKDTRWLVRLAVAQLPPEPPPVLYLMDKAAWGDRLRASLGDAIRQRYGNPLVVWFLLYVVVPVLVRLVIEWWLQRRKA